MVEALCGFFIWFFCLSVISGSNITDWIDLLFKRR